MRRLLGIFAALIFCMPQPVFAGSELDVLIERAIREKEAGRLPESLAALREAYALEPLPVLLNNISALLMELGRYKEAKEASDRVAADRAADPELRARAAERSALLAAKVELGWLILEVTPASAQVLVDGAAPRGAGHSILALEYEGAREIAAAPGRRILEARVPGSREIVLRFVTFTAGERASLSEELALPGENDARIDLTSSPYPLDFVIVDKYRVRGQNISYLRLPAGEYLVEVGFRGAPPIARKLSLQPGQRRSFFSTPAPAPVVTMTPAAAPAEPVSQRSWWPLLAAGGAGAAIGAGGAALLISAGAERDRVRAAIAGQDPIGAITQRAAYEAQASADNKATLGTAGLILGSAVITAAVVWWLSG